MFNPHNSKEIVFPHVIPTTILDGKQYSFNNVNGAIKPIGYFGLTTNTFLGGQCKIMGFINELGPIHRNRIRQTNDPEGVSY
jgi:hypothetical protein